MRPQTPPSTKILILINSKTSNPLQYPYLLTVCPAQEGRSKKLKTTEYRAARPLYVAKHLEGRIHAEAASVSPTQPRTRFQSQKQLFFFGRYGPCGLRLQLSVPTKQIETNKHKKTAVKQRSELLNYLLRTLSAAAVQQLGVVPLSDSAEVTAGPHPKPPKTTGGAQDQGSGRRSSPVGQRQPPHLVSCESCIPKSKGTVQGEPKRPDGQCHPAVIATAPAYHTLRVKSAG